LAAGAAKLAVGAGVQQHGTQHWAGGAEQATGAWQG
jgi:hypothetical protein